MPRPASVETLHAASLFFAGEAGLAPYDSAICDQEEAGITEHGLAVTARRVCIFEAAQTFVLEALLVFFAIRAIGECLKVRSHAGAAQPLHDAAGVIHLVIVGSKPDVEARGV